tara:strand:+ start:83 stop:595 length:513 start_codon:yes stop_codon:yes gene_type:complete
MVEKNWRRIESEWLNETLISKDVSEWLLEKGGKSKLPIDEKKDREDIKLSTGLNRNNSKRGLFTDIKKNIYLQESKIDNLNHTSPTSYKLQVSIPVNINYLMKAWAAAEGRDLASVALQCLEIGIRESKGKGSIPLIALKLYENACEKRIAISEIKSKLDDFDETSEMGV